MRFAVRTFAPVAALLAATAGLTLTATPAAAAGPCTVPVVNKVACENTQPGVPESTWRVDSTDDTILGYATDMSVNIGQPVNFKVKTDAKSYSVNIYRLGWYAGNGARLMGTVAVNRTSAQAQPACLTDSTGLADCGNWGVSASWTVPSTAVSGLYDAVLHRNDTGGESEIFFVVRDDSSHAAVAFQTSDPTWQAYNRYGGNSLYSGTGPGVDGSSWKVSYNRPLDGTSGQENLPFNAEYPMIRWLESNGYDVTYLSGVDTDRYGATLLPNHRLFMSVGHDEYWSGQQRANVEAAKAAGVNLAFFSGNEIFWKTRWENSIDSSGATYRTLVCYKETKWNAKIDPSPQWTGTWRDPRFSPPSDGGRPENALIGQLFQVNGYRSDNMQVPAAYGKMRLWRNTPLAQMAAGTTYTFPTGSLGYEWDVYADNGVQPPGVARLSSTTVTMTGDYLLQNYGDLYGPGTATHALTLYRDQTSHALVFGAGTVQWSWGLDDDHSFSTGTSTVDTRIQQATVNLFADMGITAATLQAGLVQTTASTDTTAPGVTINAPASPQVGNPVALTGTVADATGQVAGVEVSVDGTTWHPATWQAGSGTWSYSFTPTKSGTVTVRARATDDSANLSSPVSRAVTVAPRACPCSVWSNTALPAVPAANDSSVLELGMKFRSDVTGWVSGVRFYKGTGNTGTHTGSLWSSTGTLLATGTFTGETATGWQTLTFGVPVQILAGTTYVVSYHTNAGHYASDNGFFTGNSVYNEPLTALADGTDGPNGVYREGASGFPSNTYGATNYWVDVVFGTNRPPDTQPPAVAATSPAAGATGVQLTATPSATFNEPVSSTGLTFTLTSAGGSVSGTVALDGTGTVATFSPSAGLAGATTYTATVRASDTSGNQMPSAFSWTFTTGKPRPAACPCTIWDDFVQPAQPSTNDGSAIDVGTKVRFDLNGYVTGVRFYKGTLNTGTHTGTLWSATGQQLATGTFTNETASGWQTLTLGTPVKVTANTVYVVSYHTNSGFYASTSGYFGSTGADYQQLHALKDGVSGGNGVYHYGSTSAFPTSTYNSTNYWVDVLWTNSLSGDTTPPTVTATTPTDGATNVANTAPLTATFSEAIDPTSLSFTLADAAGARISGTVTYNAATKTATLTPGSALSAGETYTATIQASDVDSNPMPNPVKVLFTTSSTQTCPCSLFPLATVPTVTSAADTGSYQLGVRFSSSTAQAVTAIRFYKGAANTGTHTGSLWAADGTLLATGTFTNETATGWQTLTLASPVNIQPNVVYVASYTTPNGGYAADNGYFEVGPATSVPLTAPATGGAGANGVYGLGTAFPTNTYRGTNYWVDVVVGPPVSGLASAVTGATTSVVPGTVVGPASTVRTPVESPLAVVERVRVRRTDERRGRLPR